MTDITPKAVLLEALKHYRMSRDIKEDYEEKVRKDKMIEACVAIISNTDNSMLENHPEWLQHKPE